MTRIDFAFGAPNRLRTTCDVVRRHYLAGRELLIYCSNSTLLLEFDRLLWGFEPTAFVPHVRADDAFASRTPVILCEASPLQAAQTLFDTPPWLVNLDVQCPPDFAGFTRILEIVSSLDEDRIAARERWRHYTAAGIAPKAHDLSARPA